MSHPPNTPYGLPQDTKGRWKQSQSISVAECIQSVAKNTQPNLAKDKFACWACALNCATHLVAADTPFCWHVHWFCKICINVVFAFVMQLILFGEIGNVCARRKLQRPRLRFPWRTISFLRLLTRCTTTLLTSMRTASLTRRGTTLLTWSNSTLLTRVQLLCWHSSKLFYW